MKHKEFRYSFKDFLKATLTVIFVAFVLYFGVLENLDRRISDIMYQKPSNIGDNIVVIGIDENVLNEYGLLAFWERRKIAEVVEYLNRDSAMRPAVIGVDTLFTGKNPYDNEGDKMLVDAASRFNNVVFAASAKWQKLDKEGHPYAKYLDLPYEPLPDVAKVGNVWLPNEKDGVTRHGLLTVKVMWEQDEFLSFSRAIYEKWCEYNEIEPNPPPVTDKRGIFYLPFAKENFGKNISIIELLEGKLSPSDYKDKIVLIGIRASGMGDDFKVALNHKQMYGVDIHANEIAAFMRNFFPVEINDKAQFTFLLIFLFALELFFQKAKMERIILCWGFVSALWFLICYVGFFYGKIVLHVVYVPFFTTLLLIVAVARNYFSAKAEKIRIYASFERYFDRSIINEITAKNSDALRLGGNLTEIAVLFADIRNFTAMSEKFNKNPEIVADILNRYLSMTTQCVKAYRGTLDKFVGDQIMAFWNAPVKDEHAPLLAAKSALSMIKNLNELQHSIKRDYNCEVTFGVGIHWGKAFVGNIGSELRMDYTAIGDTVNTAARLEANAPGGKIYISRAMAEVLGGSAKVKPLETILNLKGKSEKIEILELISIDNEVKIFDTTK